MNAILKYPGGKWRIADWIIDHFPDHKVYLEPYFGSGAVFFTKTPALIETINDIDGNVVNLFRVCRNNPEELCRLIELTPFRREEYIDCYEMDGNDIERARKTIVRFWQSFGTSNSSLRSWKNSQTGNSPNNTRQWVQLPDVIMNCCDRLKQAQIENYDAVELIKRYDSPETLIYADPPYIQGIRKKNIYKHELDNDGQIRLLAALKESKSQIILSGYDNDLYNEYLKDWYTDAKVTQAQMGLPRTEKIWCNFMPQYKLF